MTQAPEMEKAVEAERREEVWLIERHQVYASSYGTSPDWSTDPWRAERYKTFDEAEFARLRITLDQFRNEAQSTLHLFIYAPQPKDNARVHHSGNTAAPSLSLSDGRETIRKMLAAWDVLPKGYYSSYAIERWLNKDIGPVIQDARDFVSALPAPECRAREREQRQQVVVEWGARCFGADHMADKIVRAARFFEEAAELVQAVGLSRDHALRAFDHVYSRSAGEPWQEAGGVGVTLMALCNALGLSADDCEVKEIARCLSKTPESFAARNVAKIEQVDAPALSASPPRSPEPHCTLNRGELLALWRREPDPLKAVAEIFAHTSFSSPEGWQERALQIIADEERLAAGDDNTQLYALRAARVGAAKQILGLLPMSGSLPAAPLAEPGE